MNLLEPDPYKNYIDPNSSVNLLKPDLCKNYKNPNQLSSVPATFFSSTSAPSTSQVEFNEEFKLAPMPLDETIENVDQRLRAAAAVLKKKRKKIDYASICKTDPTLNISEQFYLKKEREIPLKYGKYSPKKINLNSQPTLLNPNLNMTSPNIGVENSVQKVQAAVRNNLFPQNFWSSYPHKKKDWNKHKPY